MKVLILQGSLKKAIKDSNTDVLVKLISNSFKDKGSTTNVVQLANRKFEYGTGMNTQNDEKDDMTEVISKILSADAVIFATPIWWDNHSSLIQSVIERMDSIESWSYNNKFYPLYGKIFGVAVSGSSDGYQKIYGQLFYWATSLGFTIPPHCGVYSFAQGKEKILKDKSLNEKIDKMTKNMIAWHSALSSSEDNWGMKVQK